MHSNSALWAIHQVSLQNAYIDKNFGEKGVGVRENNFWPNINRGNYSTWDTNPLFPK